MNRITMLSSAEKVKGQGVASAYRELINLMTTHHADKYDIAINTYRKSDITHYHTIDFPFFLSTFRRKRRGVMVGYVHFLPETLDESLKLPWIAKKIFYKYVILFYKRMDVLVVVNPSFIPQLVAYGIPKEKIKYIPNFVSAKTFYPMSGAEKLALRREHGIAPDAFVAIGVGQVQHRKGVLDFIEVAKQLPEMQFIWVGGFSFGKITAGYKELKEIYDHPPKNVQFPGIVERADMNAYYNMADVLFLPSFNELFPMAILEGMSSGLAVLLRDLELYEGILAGNYMQASDVALFQGELERMAKDQAYMQTAKDGAKKGADYYSEARLTGLWQEFYDGLLKG
ncbi:glycosyltransferase family 4 protein [Listeria grandensis]|uniref:Glycosyltransferase family 4 protein n=1 Tax=Listeria grandensis TaxID=1494963 RepID=A0A7X0Y421_9LIST|nr:glycosyltransferase family 4 protein [Listeria grandensis]MBC1936214.1 glycosyltransferase family 4 protein [Listeria grandensis]